MVFATKLAGTLPTRVQKTFSGLSLLLWWPQFHGQNLRFFPIGHCPLTLLLHIPPISDKCTLCLFSSDIFLRIITWSSVHVVSDSTLFSAWVVVLFFCRNVSSLFIGLSLQFYYFRFFSWVNWNRGHKQKLIFLSFIALPWLLVTELELLNGKTAIFYILGKSCTLHRDWRFWQRINIFLPLG